MLRMGHALYFSSIVRFILRICLTIFKSECKGTKLSESKQISEVIICKYVALYNINIFYIFDKFLYFSIANKKVSKPLLGAFLW